MNNCKPGTVPVCGRSAVGVLVLSENVVQFWGDLRASVHSGMLLLPLRRILYSQPLYLEFSEQTLLHSTIDTPCESRL
jgi:hypothetical protein